MTRAQMAMQNAIITLDGLLDERPEIRSQLKPLRDFTQNLLESWDTVASTLVHESLAMRALIERALLILPEADSTGLRAQLEAADPARMDFTLSALERQRDACAETFIALQAELECLPYAPDGEEAALLRDMTAHLVRFAGARMPSIRMW